VCLEQKTEFRDVRDLLRREFAHERPALRQDLDPPFSSQSGKRRSNRGAAEIEVFGKPGFGQLFARPVAEVENAPFDLLIGLERGLLGEKRHLPNILVD
jgi:hypothetical protein